MRIDQAIAPATLLRSAAAYSLFIVDEGVYAIRTGRGWRMQVRGRLRNEAMAAAARRVEAMLDPGDLAGELSARAGSSFIPRAELSAVVLSRRHDGLPDLRFTGGERSHRFQFDVDRLDDVETFVAAMSSASPRRAPAPVGSADDSERRSVLKVDGRTVQTVPLPPPCWGATPHVAVADGRLLVEYLAPTGARHGEKHLVYRPTEGEQTAFATSRLDLLALCQRLVREAWGTTPPPSADGTPPNP